MDTREKMIELIAAGGFFSRSADAEKCVDHLIANGVTAQQWIPVSERLPVDFVSVLVCIPCDRQLPVVHEAYLADGLWVTKTSFYRKKDVSHWMPMPEPPKGY